MDLPLMMANFVAPSSVIVLTRNAPGGTSPWSVPPDATFPVGFQLIGQNGLRVPASIVKVDLVLSAIIADSSCFFGVAVAGATSSVALIFGAAGAVRAVPAAKRSAGAAKIDIKTRERNLFIAFQ